jgi:hypothetical protein
MTTTRSSKVNQLMNSFQRGVVLVSGFLKKRGYSIWLLDWYKNGGWLEAVGQGAYRFRGDKVSWTGAVCSLQTQLNLPAHVGARTALELQGYGHYMSSGLRTVFLFGSPGVRLPKWFTGHDWGVTVEYITTKVFSATLSASFTEYEEKGYTVRLSSPERAIMETLYLVPDKQGFDEAFRLMEGLTTLRPDLVQQVLEQCSSVKVKRLFLYMAERAGHAWLSGLNINQIDLGKGKRMLHKGGTFVAKYGITVPATLEREQ